MTEGPGSTRLSARGLVTHQGLLARLVRFGLVGVANTAVYYACYRLALLVLPYLAAHLIAWALSVVFSFFMNCWFTYHVRPTWRRLLAFPASSLVNLGLTTFGSVLLVEGLHVDERYATVIMGIAAIPFTFAITTLVLTGGRRGEQPDAAPADPAEPTSPTRG